MKKILMATAIGIMYLSGCETTRPTVEYPGLTPVPGQAVSTLRETDHCFIDSIDGKAISQYDVNILSPGTYRVYELPAGQHTLAVHYRAERNFEMLAAGPRQVDIKLQPGEHYLLASNTNGIEPLFGNIIHTVNWRPAVTDAHTGQCVGQAAINVEANAD